MIAIIGGTGLSQLPGFKLETEEQLATPYSDSKVTLACGTLQGQPLCFLPRHGKDHTIPPHRINYRANIQALKTLGVENVIAVNAVGGIHEKMGPGVIAVPLQIVDYSHGREHTFFDGESGLVSHIDFTDPYDETLRQRLISSARLRGVAVWEEGVYACTQGPRLESAAEIRRLSNDGCDMVGMTGMPEAALARELEMAYACLALSVNWAAGLTDEIITMEAILAVLQTGMDDVREILQQAITG